jgi:hypothetical protein
VRTARWLAATAVLLAACGPVIRVTTRVAPDANLAALRSFRILDVPTRSGGTSSTSDDPMVINSITNRALRENLSTAFRERGYTVDLSIPDFTVAYYAILRDTLLTHIYDYGYIDRWGVIRDTESEVTSHSVQGRVIIDVVNPKTRELVWRGHGVSDVSDDPHTYAENLARTVRAIVREFPGR